MAHSNYESFHDVEQPDPVQRPVPYDILIAKAQERYPEAGTKIEAEFLGRLDDAIENAQPKIVLPRISPDQLRVSSTPSSPEKIAIANKNSLLSAMKFPTLALISMIAVALVLMIKNSPLANALYPYLACLVTFLSSIPDLRQRFVATVLPVFDQIDMLKGQIQQRIENVSTTGFQYLTVTESAMNRAIAPIKEKAAMATQLEVALRQVDPTIDIPDPSDIEKKFNEFNDTLKTGFGGMQTAVDFTRTLPAPLQSIENYQLYIMVPIFTVMLVLQLLGAYYSTATTAAATVLREVDNVEDGGQESEGGSMEEPDQWFNFWMAIQSYLSTVIQIMLAFCLTQAKVMAVIINAQIAVLERNINRELQNSVGDVFEKIFHKGFGAVKQQFLTLVRKIDKIEGPINAIKSKIPGGGNINIGRLPTNMNLPTSAQSLLGKFGKK